MGLITVASIEQVSGLGAEACERVLSYASRAERAVRQVVTDEVYDEITARDTGDVDRQDLVTAEATLAYAYALTLLNLRVTDKGGLVRAIGWDQTRQELMTPYQVKRLQRELIESARALIRPLGPEKPPLYRI